MKEELDSGRLTSVDENGDRLAIIPAEVRGYFRRHRTRVQWVLLILFLALPWTEISGRQTVWLDIPERRFLLFGAIFRAHEVPLLFFLLAISCLGLALVTSIWGRVWCGWACPQTVFIDAIYRRIEIWVEGNYIQRRQLQTESLSFRKTKKKITKWFLFFIVSSLIAHSFMAYFTGAKNLIQMIQNDPLQNWNYFLLASFFTALILFDFAWFREQFCVIMCPYGRIQSVLLDPSSLAVVYDQGRGEPRRGSAVAVSAGKSGDCVSCHRCVQVCPTGIDIRNGLQMECIACTACIDACDEIMEKVKKPRGLIAYKTLDASPFKILKLKTIFYGLLILLAFIGLSFNLSTRAPINIAVLRAIEAPYNLITEPDRTQSVLNHFRLHLTNQSADEGLYRLSLVPSELNPNVQLTVAPNPLVIPKDGSQTSHLFLKAPLDAFKNHELKVKIKIHKEPEGPDYERELILLGPFHE